MADEAKLNIQKAIDAGSQHTTLDNLAQRGIRNVKVLDERAILELISRAVNQVISTQTDEERARIVADSRRELDRIMKERNEFMSQAGMLEAGKNDLVQQVEKLQSELKLRRQVEEKGDALLKELVDGHQATQEKNQSLQEENALLRQEHDRGVEELDRARMENRRLNQEIEKLRTGFETDLAGLRAELESLRKEATRSKELPTREPVKAPAPSPKAVAPVSTESSFEKGGVRKGKGLDIGTVNLVAAEQDKNGDVALRIKRNAFIDVEITSYTKSMLTRLKVPYVVQGRKMYLMGEEAFELANVLNRPLRRPMKDGLISPKEQDALPVMKLLIGSILGEPRVPNESCFYSVPGDPVDSDLSVAYHRDLFDAVLQALGYAPKHIIEGHAVTFAELADDDFTGIGISCGGGMFNVCVAYKSMPALTFSTSRSGDWVDMNVAQALGIKPAKVALLKEKGIDLLDPKNREEDAIAIYYRNLIKYNLTNIADRFRTAENMPSFTEPISMVFSGGTAMAGNFIKLVMEVFKDLDFPIPVKEIRLAGDPFHATAKGALTAAMLDMSQPQTPT